MLEPGLVEHECGLEEGVIQPRTHDFLALWTKGRWEGLLEHFRVVEETADEEVGVGGIHPCVEHLFLTNDGPEGSFHIFKRTQVFPGFTVEHTAACWWLIFPGLDIRSRRWNDDLRLVLAVPNGNFSVVPSAAADGPVDADVVHPVQEELTVSNRVKGDGFNVLPHAVLDVCLTNVPLFEQDDFNRIFSSL